MRNLPLERLKIIIAWERKMENEVCIFQIVKFNIDKISSNRLLVFIYYICVLQFYVVIFVFKMSSLIRARDFELDRMYRKCEQAVNASITKDDRVIPESGQHLSRLNEQIRVRVSYSN